MQKILIPSPPPVLEGTFDFPSCSRYQQRPKQYIFKTHRSCLPLALVYFYTKLSTRVSTCWINKKDWIPDLLAVAVLQNVYIYLREGAKTKLGILEISMPIRTKEAQVGIPWPHPSSAWVRTRIMPGDEMKNIFAAKQIIPLCTRTNSVTGVGVYETRHLFRLIKNDCLLNTR